MAAAAAITLVGAAAPAWAGDIDFMDMFRNVGYLQTGDGATLGNNGSFLSTTVHTLGGEAYTSAAVAFGGAMSPLPLAASGVNQLGYQSAAYATKADMDAAFPAGSYSYSLQTATSTLTAGYTLGSDEHYAASTPYLAGSSYSALQGANAAAPLTLQFSPFATDSAASVSYIFFTIYDYTDSQFVFNDGFQAASTSSEFLPANLLLPGHQYGYELIFSSRVLVTGDGSNLPDQIGYELRTSGLFATAVPEAPAWLMMLGGLGLVGGWRRRRVAR